jgi:Rrf2 family protein
MLYIAGKVDQAAYEFIPTQQISRDLNIPPSTAGVILRRLNRARLIQTREGVNGGVRLAQSPESITILDIFLAIEQERPMFQTNFHLPVAGEKPTKIERSIMQVLENAEESMKQSLQGVTMRDLMNLIKS